VTVEPFGYIEIFLILASFFMSIESVTIIMACLTIFMTASCFTVLNVPLNPSVSFLPIYILRAALDQKTYFFKNWGTSHFLFISFIAYALIITATMPTLLGDQITVVWHSRNTTIPAIHSLKPDTGNITQSLYAIGGILCFFASFAIFNTKNGPKLLIKTICCVCFFNIFWSTIDTVTAFTGTSHYLDFIRNINYTILDQNEVSGIRRVVGTFTEASTYSIFGLSILSGMFALYRYSVTSFLFGFKCVLSLVFLLLTMSTTAFVGLVIYCAWFMATQLYIGFLTGRFSLPIIFLFFIVVFTLFTIVLWYTTGERVELLDTIIVNKLSSKSGIERSFWNKTAWDAFLGSLGLGIGLGSTRASSFFLILLSNVGLLGTILYFSAVYNAVKIKKKDISSEAKTAILACRESIVALFIGAGISGMVFDLGLWIYLIVGAAAGITTFNGHLLEKKPQLILNSERAALLHECVLRRGGAV